MINNRSAKRVGGVFFAFIVFVTGCATPLKTPVADSPSATFSQLKEIMAGDASAPEIRGVWRSRGYGWVFDISETGLTQYHIQGDACFETPEAAKGLTETLSLDYRFYRTGPGGAEAILQLLPDDTEIRVDRLSSLPAQCASDRDWSYADILDYFVDLVAAEYAFFDERNIDWSARALAAQARIGSIDDDAAFYDLLASMIDGFSDSHTKLIAEIDGEKRRQQDGLGETLTFVRAQEAETPWLIGIFSALQQDILDPGSQHVANDRILWGLIDDRIGYIQVLTMGGFAGVDIGDPAFREAEFAAFDEVFDEALTAMDGAEAVILDLSNNRGGYDAISRRLASRFTDAPFEAYTTRAPSSGVPARKREIEPAEGDVFTGPVYLLTSDVTVSGGEIATLSMRQLPHVTHVGATTRGSFSTVLSKPLPNGWVIELSNEVFAAPDGTVYEETGIAPEIEFAVFPQDNPVSGHGVAIKWIIELID